jgi:hypothetical protein
MSEQKTEESKFELPVLMTAGLMQLKINTEVTKSKMTVADLEKRALAVIKNEDNLTVMRDLLADLKKVDDLAEKTHETVKKPYWDAGKACDAGKKLVLDQTARIRGMFKAEYDKLLAAIAERTRLQNLKTAQDAAILKGIEDNVIVFSNKIVAAITKKALSEVESLINLQKSPSMAKKYGEFHQQAISRYDSILLPIIRDQKKKVEELEKLNASLTAAEAANDPDKMDEIMVKVDEISNEILQNHAVVQEAALSQDSFPVVEAVEVLPEFKNKRTNFNYEIVDLDIALKKSRDLLEITINNKAAKLVKDQLVKDGAFEGKDEVIVDGIRYIATRVREAL